MWTIFHNTAVLSDICSPISWSQELSALLHPSGILTTFCQKADMVGYFISVEIWWTGWALLHFCCNRRRFLRAWTKDVLFLLMNKLPAAKQNITKLNRTECVLRFKRLVLFWQESKANVNAEDKSERTKSRLSRLVRNQVSLMDTSICKTCLSSWVLEEETLLSEPLGRRNPVLNPWLLIIQVRDAPH